jgi:excisionase family DNA binding protein
MICYDWIARRAAERTDMEEKERGRWLTVDEIAEELKVHKQSVRRWIRDHDLPAIALGGKSGFRIWSEDLDRFLEEKSTAPGKAAA